MDASETAEETDVMDGPEAVPIRIGFGVERLRSLVERVTESASVRSVYGEPIEAGGRTVIPVARVLYGFGGGYGQGSNGEGMDGSAGTGGGAGVRASPVGVVEVSEDGTRFVRFADRRRLGLVALAGAAVGYLLGRR